jgi:hypothetical protein
MSRALDALYVMSGGASGAASMDAAALAKVDKSRESDPRRQALSTDEGMAEILRGHRGSAAREAPGPPVVSVKDLGSEGFVVGRGGGDGSILDALSVMSGYAAVGGPHGGGGGGGGHHGGGHHGGHHGGGHHGGHHGGGRRRRGWGGGPWPWGAVLDNGPAYVIDTLDTDECSDGPTLFMPSGERVCPGDPRYPALARAHAALHSTGANPYEFATGDLTCSGVDVDAWKAANRVRLRPSERHRWLLAVSTAGRLSDMSESQLRADIEGGVTTGSIFGKWFERVSGIPFSGDFIGTAGTIDNVKMLAFGEKSTMLAVADKAGLVIEQRAEDLPGSESLKVTEPKVYVLVEFVYRTMQSTMPWPVYNDATFANKWCPVDAQVALSVTFKPSADSKNVPKPTGLGNPSTFLPVPSTEDIANAAASVFKGAGQAASDIGASLMYAGLGIAAIAAVVVLKK